MNQQFANKIVVVTGGAQGIGRSICECFLNAGASVVVADLRAPNDPEEWVKQVDNQVQWLPVDVTSIDSIQMLANQLDERFGGVDVLVNNAGIMFQKSIEEQTEQDWDLMMAVNVKGPVMMTKYLLPLLRKKVAENGSASIVNIGSIEGDAANPLHTAYGASKAAVHGLTRNLALDLGAEGIRVNAIAPGWIDTDLNREYVESVGDIELAKRELAKLHPVGHIGDPRDVGDTAVWLAGAESRFVCGQIITVDGGRTRKLSLPGIFE